MTLIIAPAAEAGKTGVVVSQLLNVRKGPDRLQPSIAVLKQETRVVVLDEVDGWLKISINDLTGFVRNRAKYIRIEVPQTPPGSSENPENPKQEQLKQQSKDLDRKIAEHTAEVQEYHEKETAIINGLNDLELTLNQAGQRTTALRTELNELEKQIAETDLAIQALIQEIRKSEKYIHKRLVAIYKLNLLGQVHILASANSLFDLINRKAAIEHILDYDEAALKKYLEDKDHQLELSQRLNQQRKEKIEIEKNFQKQIKMLSTKRTKRAKLLEHIRNKKSLELAAIDSLKQAAQALDQTIMSLHVEPKKSSSKTKNQFNALKGLLNMPVKGKVISFFGPYKNTKFNVINYRSGIEIQAERGEPIRAVSDGLVLFSGWFKSYGNMMIIDHGNNYYTIYAHAEELFKSKGDPVEATEVIATVGDSASLTGESNLYFEVRHHGKPLDPLVWLKKG
ncbi:MAG: peptidoglycan DD-metalloendopeptidase family protein [Thermodesulfobacteriota bacterium]